MKIELKKIEFSERMSEETNCFAADIYINDVNVGIASNQGHGGATGYTANHPKGMELIKQAEDYCKSLPPYTWDSGGEAHKLEMNLELFIDNLLENYLKEKEIKKFRNKIAKAALNSIVVGIPDHSFTSYPFKYTIAEILRYPNGQQLLADSIGKRIKPKMVDGEIILNTNIPEQVFALAKLKNDQYFKAEAPTVQQRKPVKKHSRKM